MTWEEALEAFRCQRPVTYFNCITTHAPIHCTRIAELTLRATASGDVVKIVGGMDRNEHCVYHDRPENFSLE